MNPVIRFLRGEIRVCISGAYVERCFNLFAEEGIVFWDLCHMLKCSLCISRQISPF